MGKIEWEYEDFEFDNRVTNLMWTVCGNYAEEMALSEKTNLSENLALYFGITAGGRRKHADFKFIDAYLNWRCQQGFSRPKLQAMLLPALNIYAVNRLIDERPGIDLIRRKACAEMIAILLEPLSQTFQDELDFAIFSHLGKCTIKTSLTQDTLAIDLIEAANVPNCQTLAAAVDHLYIRFFAPPSCLPFSETAIESDPKTAQPTTEKQLQKKLDRLLSQEGFQSDTTPEEGGVANAGTTFIDQDQLDELHKNVGQLCGESYLEDNRRRRLEHHLCKGPHKDCHLHFTDGLLRCPDCNPSRVKSAEKERQKNDAAYLEKQAIYEQTIRRLRDSLLRTLTTEREKNPVISDSGEICVPRLWRIGCVTATRIFKRQESNDKGAYVVDILIDSSYSQKGRESRVSIQAYIIARALIEAGIPCRVNGFYCFLDFTVLKRFRDYDAPLSDTRNIFEYSCEGSNRDGLAIKSICDTLYRRNEDNKILIILSDGKPNDVHIIKDHGQPFRGQCAYSGGLAIGDTAKEVRIARQLGIMVLGIFTGDESERAAEQQIYGKDFIYTRDVRHFADIVATYLKRIITR